MRALVRSIDTTQPSPVDCRAIDSAVLKAHVHKPRPGQRLKFIGFVFNFPDRWTLARSPADRVARHQIKRRRTKVLRDYSSTP